MRLGQTQRERLEVLGSLLIGIMIFLREEREGG